MAPRKAMIACTAFWASATSLAWSSGPVIEHAGVGCVVAERLARIDAGVTPLERIAKARLFFRASETSHWYFVEMTAESSSFLGVLPKAKKETARLDYYIEATDRDLQVAKTAEFSPRVVPGAEACDSDMVVAGTVAAAVVKVAAPPGAPAVPVGFSASGIVLLGTAAAAAGAAGGVSATTVAIGAVGAGAAVAAAAAVLGGGGETSAPTPAPTPDTTFTRYFGAYTVTYVRHPSSAAGCFDERSLGTFATTLGGDASGGNFYFQQSASSARWAGAIQPDGRFQAAQSDGVVTVEGRTDGTRITGTTLTRFCRSDFDGSR